MASGPYQQNQQHFVVDIFGRSKTTYDPPNQHYTLGVLKHTRYMILPYDREKENVTRVTFISAFWRSLEKRHTQTVILVLIEACGYGFVLSCGQRNDSTIPISHFLKASWTLRASRTFLYRVFCNIRLALFSTWWTACQVELSVC